MDVLDGVNNANEKALVHQASGTKAVVQTEEQRTLIAASTAVKDFYHPILPAGEKPSSWEYLQPPQATNDPKQLAKSLDEFKIFIDHSKKVYKSLWDAPGDFVHIYILTNDTMAAIQHFTAKLPPPTDKFWNEIPSVDTAACLRTLSEINNAYGQAIANKTKHPNSSIQQLTLFNLYANIHRLAIKADSESGLPILSDFKVDITRFRDAMDLDPMHTYGSFRMIERRRAIENYFDGRSNSKNNGLFKWDLEMGVKPKGADDLLYQAMLKNPDLAKEMDSGEIGDCIKRWARANPTLVALGGDEGVANSEADFKRSVLHLDMGEIPIVGLKDTWGAIGSTYENVNATHSKIHVEFKEGDSGMRSQFSLESVLAKHFPYIATLKQASLGAAVLLDINTINSKNPVYVEDVDGNKVKKKNDCNFPERARHLARQRAEIWQDDEFEHKVHIGFYGRSLGPAPEGKTNISDKDKRFGDRLFTSSQLSKAGNNAIAEGMHTEMYQARVDEHKQQNDTLAMLGSKSTDNNLQTTSLELAELTSSNAVSDHNLVQWIRNHPLSLRDPATRERLMVLFFRPQHAGDYGSLSVPILNNLKNYPDHIVPQIRNLISEGITRYYRAQPNKRAEVEPLVFLLTLAQQIDRNYFEIHSEHINPPLYDENLFSQIMTLSENARVFNEKELMLLRLSQFFHLFPHASPEQASEEELQDAALAFIRVTDAGIESKSEEFGALLLEQLKEGSNQLVGEFLRRSNGKDLTAGFAARFAVRLSKDLNLPCSLEFTPGSKPLPVLRGTDPKGVKWEVNLKSGEILRDGKPTKLGGSRPKKEDFPLWDHLLGDRKHVFRKEGGYQSHHYLDFIDPIYGKMRYIELGKFLQREFSGKWYTAAAPSDTKLDQVVPACLRSGYSHWVAENPVAGEIAVLVCDLKTGLPAYIQDVSGAFIAVNIPENWDGKAASLIDSSQKRIVRFPSNNSFQRLANPSSYIGLSETKDATDASQILFPQISSSNGEPVRFDRRRDGRWIYAADPSYALADPQLNQLFPHHNQYLVIEKLGRPDDRQLLMLQPPLPKGKLKSNAYDPQIQFEIPGADPFAAEKIFAQIRTYQFVDGELRGEKAEEKLFLAWQYLIGKDYSSAITLLRKLGAGDKLTENCKLIINAILTSAKDGNDFSPEACAVRLKALWLVKMLDPDYTAPQGIREIFADYLQGLERMPADLRLNTRELHDLHSKFIEIGVIPTEATEWNISFKPADSIKVATTAPWNYNGHIISLPKIPKERPPFSNDHQKNWPRTVADMDMKDYFCTKVAGEQNASAEMPIFGEAQISVDQFYVIYNALNDPNLSQKKKEEIGYRLYHSAATQGFNEKSDKATIARLNILYALYQKGAGSLPQLPENKADVEQWWSWWGLLHGKNDKYWYGDTPPPQAGFKEEGPSAVQNKSLPARDSVATTSDRAETFVKLKTQLPQIKIDISLKKLAEAHFTAGKTELSTPPLKPLETPSKETLSDKDQQYTKAIEKEFDTYNGDVETARKEALAQIAYKLKAGTDEKQLKQDIAAFVDQKNGMEAELLKKEEDKDLDEVAQSTLAPPPALEPIPKEATIESYAFKEFTTEYKDGASKEFTAEYVDSVTQEKEEITHSIQLPPAGSKPVDIPVVVPAKVSPASAFFKGAAQVILSAFLSIGISQIFGLAKGAVDLGRKLAVYLRLKKIENLQSKINASTVSGRMLDQNEFKKLERDTKRFFRTEAIGDLFSKAITEDTKKEALRDLSGRMENVHKESEDRMNRLNLALKADAAALIPLAGAGLYWKMTHIKEAR